MKKNILILYTSSGYGHKKIAENIGSVLADEYDVDLKNLFEVEQGAIVDQGTNLYLWILQKVPWLWNFFYTNKLFLVLTLPFRRTVASFKSKKVLELLHEKQYDAVICTQVNASAIVSYLKLKNLYTGKLIVTFSDFHLHRYWLYDNVDLYLANITEQKKLMEQMGVPPDTIAICGITLPETSIVVDKEFVRNKFSLFPGRKTILMLGGGRGLGIDEDKITELCAIDADIMVVCGFNTELQKNLSETYRDKQNVKVLGFVSPLEELYSIADVIITKPGGLTIAECLKYDLAIVVYTYLPGQEAFNFDFLIKRKLILPIMGDLANAVKREIETGEFRESLTQNEFVSEVVQYGQTVKEYVGKLLHG